MSNFTPSPPWKYRCEHCDWYIVVNARGAHGNDPGSGVEAALLMRDHVAANHPSLARLNTDGSE